MNKHNNFDHYELTVLRKMRQWQKEVQKPQGKMNQWSKKFQDKFNKLIPDKIHNGITVIIRKIVEAVLYTSEFIKPALSDNTSLEQREAAIEKRVEFYRTTAAAEGGVTGFGGILAAMADFPALLTIKLKFLFDVAALYGYDTQKVSERIYLLYVFQLAFSSPTRQMDTYSHLALWAAVPQSMPNDPNELDWYRFQQDYRDYLDVAKLLQMMPGIGAAVGLVVNYNLLNKLADTAKMCYRMRWLHDKAQRKL